MGPYIELEFPSTCARFLLNTVWMSKDTPVENGNWSLCANILFVILIPFFRLLRIFVLVAGQTAVVANGKENADSSVVEKNGEAAAPTSETISPLSITVQSPAGGSGAQVKMQVLAHAFFWYTIQMVRLAPRFVP